MQLYKVNYSPTFVVIFLISQSASGAIPSVVIPLGIKTEVTRNTTTVNGIATSIVAPPMCPAHMYTGHAQFAKGQRGRSRFELHVVWVSTQCCMKEDRQLLDLVHALGVSSTSLKYSIII